MSHQVIGGVIYAKEGIPHAPRWFTDGRTSFQYDETGITQINYRGPRKHRSIDIAFLKGLFDSFRYYVEEEGVTYKPEFCNTIQWPFGIQADWEYGGVTYTHRVITVNEAIIIELRIPKAVENRIKFKLEWYESTQFVPSEGSDLRYYAKGIMRQWKKWERDEEGFLCGGYREEGWRNAEGASLEQEWSNNPAVAGHINQPFYETSICIGANFPWEHRISALHNKHSLRSGLIEPERSCSFVLTFGSSREEAKGKNANMLASLDYWINRQYSRYKQVSERMPVLVSPYEELNRFVSLAPMYHESLKIMDRPGAIRAKTTNYGVWGWDGITSNNASLYWGDADFIRELLRFYEATAHPDLGVAHSYNNNFDVTSISSIPAQGMYICLLQQYYNLTGNLEEVRARYGFTQKIFHLLMNTEVVGSGFCEGTSLFPDFPKLLKETGQDISTFNNTIFYCSLRAMEYLADLMDDSSTVLQATQTYTRLEAGFEALLYNPEMKYVAGSADSRTMQPRNTFSTCAIKWENHYCRELVGHLGTDLLGFIEHHALSKAGLRAFPVWDDAYDQDANQLHCWWPVTDEFFVRLCNMNNRKDLLEQWAGWVSYWTSRLLCPEGVSYHIETDRPELDRWNALSGTWQAYSMRTWYQDIIHGLMGIEIDAGGITFFPCDGEEMSIYGLHYRGKRFDISLAGSGEYIANIEVNGNPLVGTNKLPSDMYPLEERVSIVVHRVKTPLHSSVVLSACGGELINYHYEDGRIRTQLRGAGTCRLYLNAHQKRKVRLDGKLLEQADFPGNKQRFDIHFQSGRIVNLDVENMKPESGAAEGRE